ncbi:WD repeat-containing protein 87-like [Macadamia integrifolia]|uniref:WD repeat-containing protein 87-like n=1 Tax=Macadamia integrifolia TaxID=60698 RepID=UPI001C4EF550|nr:WD repeat-containing protein 87-like [Macadamia integrifolia]
MANRGSVNEFLFMKMVPFVGFLWFSISGFMFYLIRLVSRYVFRFQREDASKKDDSNCSTVEPAISKFEDSESDEEAEEDTPKFSFKFQYQNVQTQSGNEENEESKGSLATDQKCPTMRTSKRQFLSGKDFHGFMEEPEVLSFTVKELFADSKDLLQLNSETKTVQEEVEDEATDSHCKTWETGETEETEDETLTEEQLPGKDGLVVSELNLQSKEDVPTEIQFLGEKDSSALDSETESISSNDEFSLQNHFLDPKDGYLSDIDFEKPSLQTPLQNSNIVSTKTMDTKDESEVLHLLNSRIVDIGILCESDIEEEEEEEDEEEKKTEYVGGKEKEAMDYGLVKNEEPNTNRKNMQEKSQLRALEEGNELETQWEHQNLIEQLKMELKKLRNTGLPTILEESESPRVMEDLKPWKMDEKLLHEDRMEELHKFYMSYRERMRKLDIFNYQKLYAIGFLQVKDPLQSISNRKSSNPRISSILSQDFWMSKHRRAKVDPTVKFIGELQSDLEMVYVGQMCLSWEILHWQYGKAQELQESDTYGIHRYSKVIGEFLQFQVLTQRFMEYEAFQGPRVQNYVKNRCVLRNLIQVPVIKEDSLKNKKKTRRGDEDGNTTAMLTETIDKSMRIFWEFIRSDKDEASMILKGLWRTQVELQNPADLNLLTEIRTNIQKKEKKLKDILRIGNCIVKRFQKRQEDRSDLILFFSQVDMKLISRVLNMSKITSEQLVWCHKKLNKINFLDRKIHREPSFLLFPC